MNELEVRVEPDLPPREELKLAVLLASFDPPHHGHWWMARHLLANCDAVMLLIPARHFEKQVSFPHNATFEQRLRMVTRLARRTSPRVGVGLTREVLFLRLDQLVRDRYPGASTVFGMGDETYEKLLASGTYFRSSGLHWGPTEVQDLESLARRAVVFDRSGRQRGGVALPTRIRAISSTRVRRLVELNGNSWLTGEDWLSGLSHLVHRSTIAAIREFGLYRCAVVEPGCGAA